MQVCERPVLTLLVDCSVGVFGPEGGGGGAAETGAKTTPNARNDDTSHVSVRIRVTERR
jgi:hypothetical protein